MTPLRLEAQPRSGSSKGTDAAFEAWLNRITGKHRMVFDAPEPNGGMPVIWPRVWLNGNNDNYGTKDPENSAVIILRHAAIPFAMHDALWAKYKFGEMFGIKEGETPATRNIFAKPLTIYSGMAAQKMGTDAAATKAEWVAGLLPGVQVVPSGVLAVSRAQEKGCNYCFAG